MYNVLHCENMLFNVFSTTWYALDVQDIMDIECRNVIGFRSLSCQLGGCLEWRVGVAKSDVNWSWLGRLFWYISLGSNLVHFYFYVISAAFSVIFGSIETYNFLMSPR